MKDIFIPNLEVINDDILIEDVYFINYIKNVLRLNVNNSLMILSDSINYECKILNISKKKIALKIENKLFIEKSEKNIILLQSLIKLERFEIVLEKAIELGVSKIIPILTSRGKYQDIKWDNKLKRFNKIILKALTQSKQNNIPKIENPINIKDIDINSDTKIFFDIDTKLDFFNNESKISKNIAIFIGPEGGISEDEKLILKDKGFLAYRLNLPVLRSETASIVSLAIVNMRLNNE